MTFLPGFEIPEPNPLEINRSQVELHMLSVEFSVGPDKTTARADQAAFLGRLLQERSQFPELRLSVGLFNACLGAMREDIRKGWKTAQGDVEE
jgi:hypothetical protein